MVGKRLLISHKYYQPYKMKGQRSKSTDLVFITLKYLFLYTALQSYLQNSFRLKIRSIWLFCVNCELYFETYSCNSEESYTHRKHRTVRDFTTYEKLRTHLYRYQFQYNKLKVFQYTLVPHYFVYFLNFICFEQIKTAKFVNFFFQDLQIQNWVFDLMKMLLLRLEV